MMDKLTKIIATIGPSSYSEEMIKKLILGGVNIFRFNFKHSDIHWHSEGIRRVNKISDALGCTVGTLIDLQGPNLRITMSNDEIPVEKGEVLIFGEDAFAGKEKGFSMTYPNIIAELKEGQRVLADDGNFSFLVKKEGKKTYLTSETAGILKNKKSLNIPGADFPLPMLIDRDFEALKLGSREEVDFVALSFVRTAGDIRAVKKEMDKYKLKAKIVSKIETQKALDNLDEIIEESDGIMVARGDLGVELPYEEVPFYQKKIIKKSLEYGIPVITATQMLQSMVENPVPTRAEVSDVANASYDLTDAVMLSAESAAGRYPLESVTVLTRVTEYNEKQNINNSKHLFDFRVLTKTAMICDMAYNLYLSLMKENQNVRAYIVFSQTGGTVNYLSRYRSLVPIFAFVPDKKVRDSLSLNFGTFPIVQDRIHKRKEVTKSDVLRAMTVLKKKKILRKGDQVIVLHGDYWAVEGGTSTVKLLTCE